MPTDNNGAFTPPVYGDPRDISMMKSGEPAGLTVMAMPPTRPDAYTSQVELSGDVKEAGKYVPLVTQQMMQMHQQNVNNLEIVNRPVDLGGGKKIECSRNFTADKASIYVPTKAREMPPFWLNFDASTQKDFSNTFVDKAYGLGWEYDPGYSNLVPTRFDLNGSNGIGINTSDGNNSDSLWAYAQLYHSVDVQLSKSMESSAYLVATLGAYWAGEGSGEQSGGAHLWSDYYYGPVSPSFTCGLHSGYLENDAYVSKYDVFWNDGFVVTGYTSDRYKKFLMCHKGKVVDTGPVFDSGDGAGSRQLVTTLHKLYLNGAIVSEYTDQGYSYADFDNDSILLMNGHGSYGVGESVIHQKILTHKYHSEDETQATTDKLAAKWGF